MKNRARAALAWLSLMIGVLACYSPLPSEEHVCRQCDERCPDGLVCHENRCVPPDDTSRCDASNVTFELCVGRPATETVGENLVVVSSTLPDGLEFDPVSGTISGTPSRERTGVLSVRRGELGSPETTIEVRATERCAQIVTERIEWCAGTEQTTQLRAMDDAAYVWQTSELPPGVSQDGASLTGTVEEPGTYAVTVKLLEGSIVRAEARIEIVVAECKAPPEEPDAGAEGGAPAPLQIETTSLGEICAGRAYASEPLLASGGDGDYQWSLEGEATELGIDAQTGVLSAASLTSGHFELSVRVEDGQGASASQSVTLDVLPAEDERCGGASVLPVTISTSVLTGACVGRPYASVPLVATGGDGTYQWSLVDPPDWLSIAAGVNNLVGTPPAVESLRVVVRVVDGKDAADEATLTLEVRPANHQACGLTPVQITTTELPDACIGEPYTHVLTATGGDGNYPWFHREGLPPGLELQSDGTIRGTVSSVASPGDYQVSFQVASITIPAVVKTLPLRVKACGALVFVAEDSATSRLLLTRPPYVATRELSEGLLGPAESVVSFRLSSSSTKLAFLVSRATTGTPARLYMADAGTGSVRAIEWPAAISNPSVLDYVWSSDGTYVAVVAQTSQQTVLALVLGETGEISSTSVIETYRGALFSVEPKLCYLTASTRAEQSDLLCNDVVDAELAPAFYRQAGFFNSYIAGGQFVLGDQSYLAMHGRAAQGEYHDIQGTFVYPSVDHVFSSSLRWAAGLNFDGDQLELIALEPDLEFGDPVVLAPLPDCEEMLAWSEDERTLVCQGSADVRVFQLAEDGSVERTFGIAESEGHVIGEARRVISADGRWFAYDEGLALYLVDLDAGVPTSALVQQQIETSTYAGLALDSAQGRLLYHQASTLQAIELETGAILPVNGSVLLSAPPSCRLTYLDAPDLWCGADAIPATFFPSPDSDEVAFLSTARQLHVADLKSLQDTPRQVTQLPVKCTRPDGVIRCNEHVAWVDAR